MASESVLMTVALCEPPRQPGPPAALLGRLPRPLDALHLGGHRPREALGEEHKAVLRAAEPRERDTAGAVVGQLVPGALLEIAVGHRDDSRSRPISLSHRRGVAARLVGIRRTETCDGDGLDGPLGRAEIDAGPRLVVEMPVAVG